MKSKKLNIFEIYIIHKLWTTIRLHAIKDQPAVIDLIPKFAAPSFQLDTASLMIVSSV